MTNIDNIKDLLRAERDKSGKKLTNQQLGNYYENMLYAGIIRDYKIKNDITDYDIEERSTKEKMRQDKKFKIRIGIGDKTLDLSLDDLENLISQLKRDKK